METAIQPQKIRLWFIIRSLLVFCLTVYLGVCGYVWTAQRHMMYSPIRHILPPAAYHLDGFAAETLTSSDGVHIAAWYHKAHEGHPTLVYFHGIGANMSYCAPFFAKLVQEGFGVLAIDYRGFGASEGSPTEQGIYNDARAAVNFATGELKLKPEKIILYGESLGTGVAVQMATEYNAGGLALQSPYTSTVEIAQNFYPYLPVSLLMQDRYDSLSKIAHAHAPLLLMHGEEDQTIPIKYGRQLFAAANEPKQSVYYPHRGHSDMTDDERLASLLAFCDKYHLISGGVKG